MKYCRSSSCTSTLNTFEPKYKQMEATRKKLGRYEENFFERKEKAGGTTPAVW